MKCNVSIHESPYGRLPSALAAEVGDIVQCDLGMRIVTEVNPKNATVIHITGSDRPRQIEREVSKSRIIERRGEDGLKDFLQHKRAKQEEEKRLALNNPMEEEVMAKGMVKLEAGDKLCYNGEPHTVVAVTERRALMEDADGKQTWDKRIVNEFMFTDCNSGAVYRLNEQERAKHLENFLAARKPSRAKESTQPNGEEKETTEMKARVKAGKPVKSKKETKPAAAKPEANGDNNKLFGHPVTVVARTLGAKGATLETVEKVVKAHNIELRSPNTIARNFKFGQQGKYGVVELTKEQLAEFGV
jgi:hypothetical protein